MRQLSVCLILLVANGSPARNQASPASHPRAIETALDRYVAAPDSHFRFKAIADLPTGGATATLLDMTSQFRIDTIGAAYTSSPLTPVGQNTWVAGVPPPAAGWTAAFVELTFDTGGSVPLKLTTAVRVLPDTLPFPAPISKRHAPVTAPRP